MFSDIGAESISSVAQPSSSRPRPGAPRDLVKVLLAAAQKLSAQPEFRSARALLQKAGDELATMLDPDRRPDWAWFEIMFGEDACRLPEALLRAGRALGREDLVDRGIVTLEWMFSGRLMGKCLNTTADACDAAFAATGDLKWLMVSRTAILERRARPPGN